MTSHPVSVAIVNDYELVVAGIARMLEPFSDRVEIAETDPGRPVTSRVDVALFDAFARASLLATIDQLLANPLIRFVAVYTWRTDADVVQMAMDRGAGGYISKQVPAHAVVEALERIASGDEVIALGKIRPRDEPSRDWPGRDHGLTEREAEVLVMASQGWSNIEIASALYVSANTVKTHLSSVYKKLGVGNRTSAARFVAQEMA